MKIQVTTKFACDFCSKHEDQVAILIRAPRSNVCICDQCAQDCVAFARDKAKLPAPQVTS